MNEDPNKKTSGEGINQHQRPLQGSSATRLGPSLHQSCKPLGPEALVSVLPGCAGEKPQGTLRCPCSETLRGTM